MFHETPLFLLLIVNFVIFLIPISIGFFFGNKNFKKRKEEDRSLGAIVTAQIGLVAFIIAFIFGMTASRFDTRRTSLIEESNSIGTTYLRTDLLPDPQRSQLKHLLKTYVNTYMEVYRDQSKLEESAPKAGKVIDSCWKIGSAYFFEHPDQEAANSFIQALNNTIDLHSKRVTVLVHLSLPQSVWVTLYSLAMLSMLLTGFHLGLSGLKLGIPVAVLVLTFALMITMIADLDGTKSGLFKTSAQPFIELETKINSEVK